MDASPPKSSMALSFKSSSDKSSIDTTRVMRKPGDTTKEEYIKDVLSRRRPNTAQPLSPMYESFRRKKLALEHAAKAKQALSAAIDGRDGAVFRTKEQQQSTDPSEMEAKKTRALKAIRQLIDAEKEHKERERRQLVNFLQRSSTQQHHLPQPPLTREDSDRTLLSSSMDHIASNLEYASRPKGSIISTEDGIPSSSELQSKQQKPSQRTHEQQEIVDKALGALKLVNKEKRMTLIRQSSQQALTKHVARQSMETKQQQRKNQSSEDREGNETEEEDLFDSDSGGSISDMDDHDPEAETKVLLMQQAVKEAILNSHSQEDMGRVAQELLSSAARKNWKRQACIRLQAVFRGHLARTRLKQDSAQKQCRQEGS